MAQLVIINGAEVTTIFIEAAVFIKVTIFIEVATAVGFRINGLLARGVVGHKVAKIGHLI